MTVKELKEELNNYPDDMLVSTPIWCEMRYDLVQYVTKRERDVIEFYPEVKQPQNYPYRNGDKLTVVELEGDYA